MNQTEREALAVELKTAEKTLADMQAELDVFKRKQTVGCDTERGFRIIPPARGRHAELLRLVSEMTARVEALRDQLTYADRVLSYERSIEEAPGLVETAGAAMEAAEKQCAELEMRAETLRKKISEIQTGNNQLEEQAATSEAEAARKYAAVIGGDTKVEKTALAEVQRVQAESASIRARIAASAPVAAAIEAEIESLEQQAGVARAEAEEHRQVMLGATAVLLEAEWNGVASALAGIGAKLVSVRRETWRAYDGFQYLHIPVFGPGDLTIKQSDLRAMADKQNSDQLTEEGGV